jgi:DnaJ family protein A protein 5
MRCHYEVLGVARAADAGEIKKAFRLLALRWHPDKHQKNNISSEEATLRFQEIQSAYEVLSDPHEKKWYDDHREQILRGDDGQGGDAGGEDELNLFRYFSASVFSGFGADAQGFYAVYGALFAKIDELDAASADDDGDYRVAPAFGGGEALAEDVAFFYQHWRSYVTRRSFAWVDEYKTTDAPTRQVRRAMEKENKKLRDAARKAFTADVRELVEFVYRRDKRVLAMQKLKEREREQRRIEEEQRKRERQAAYDAERLAFQQQEHERWASEATSRVTDQHIAQEMEQLRKKLDADVLVCDLCRKTFKSAKQLKNHLTSKKHRDKEIELGVSTDFDLLEEEMERELRDELAAAGKLKLSDDEEDESSEKANDDTNEPPSTANNAEDTPELTLVEEERERKREEAERLRLEKEQKAAEKRKERKEKRKEKKKEGVDKIGTAARAKQDEDEDDGGRGRGKGKKGRKDRG